MPDTAYLIALLQAKADGDDDTVNELTDILRGDPEHAEALLEEARGEVVAKAFRKAAAHAPSGGAKVQGKEYRGGEFIPGEVMERATEAEKAAVGGGGEVVDEAKRSASPHKGNPPTYVTDAESLREFFNSPGVYTRLHDWRKDDEGSAFGPGNAKSVEIGGNDDTEEGYSTFNDDDEFFTYWSSRGRARPDDDTPVVMFTGEEVGSGVDGEPLAVPDMKGVTWTTYGDLFHAFNNDEIDDARDIIGPPDTVSDRQLADAIRWVIQRDEGDDEAEYAKLSELLAEHDIDDIQDAVLEELAPRK